MGAKEPCPSCSWWHDGCLLVKRGAVGDLLDQAPCEPQRWIAAWIDRFLEGFSPHQAFDREDLLQEMQLFLRKADFHLPDDLPADYVHLRRYLRSVVLNRTSDLLRKEKAAPKIRCGACVHRGLQGRCMKATTSGGGAGPGPNPHWGKPVDPSTNPAGLVPPCTEFFWRYRPIRLDEIGEARKASRNGHDLARDEINDLLAASLSDVARSGSQGFRWAYLLKEHYIEGRPATALAAELGLNERTIRRHLRAALAALRRILTEKYGVTEEDLL